MRLHRFYVGDEIELKQDFWIHEPGLIHQWSKVLRMQPGQEIVLFDGIEQDRLYKISEISDKEAHLVLITEIKRQTPDKDIYLLWSLLKKDKNDWVIQKCTELGVSHFIPIISDRCERLNLSQNMSERWKKIVIEASEQCGRSDIPNVREPIHLKTAIDELRDKVNLLVCEQSTEMENEKWKTENEKSVGVVVGPEGGWSDEEKLLFKNKGLCQLRVHDFTLRAETASVAAVTKITAKYH